MMKLMSDSVSETAKNIAAFEGKRNGGAKRETVAEFPGVKGNGSDSEPPGSHLLHP